MSVTGCYWFSFICNILNTLHSFIYLICFCFSYLVLPQMSPVEKKHPLSYNSLLSASCQSMFTLTRLQLHSRAGTVAQWVKQRPLTPTSPSRVPDASLPIQPLDKVSEKAVEDSPRTWASASHLGDDGLTTSDYPSIKHCSHLESAKKHWRALTFCLSNKLK